MIDVSVEEVRALKARLREINSLDFDEINWTLLGESLPITKAESEYWQYVGLSNADFVAYHIDQKGS
jgi:hypothetical protein